MYHVLEILWPKKIQINLIYRFMHKHYYRGYLFWNIPMSYVINLVPVWLSNETSLIEF